MCTCCSKINLSIHILFHYNVTNITKQKSCIVPGPYNEKMNLQSISWNFKVGFLMKPFTFTTTQVCQPGSYNHLQKHNGVRREWKRDTVTHSVKTASGEINTSWRSFKWYQATQFPLCGLSTALYNFTNQPYLSCWCEHQSHKHRSVYQICHQLFDFDCIKSHHDCYTEPQTFLKNQYRQWYLICYGSISVFTEKRGGRGSCGMVMFLKFKNETR